MNTRIIQQVPLFASLPASEIEYLNQTLRAADFPPGACVCKEGDYGDRFYIVAQGELEIIKACGTPDERLLGVTGPGTYVGEMSLFDPGGRRTATIRARTQTQLLEMTRADFDGLLHRQPMLTYGLVRELSARLDGANASTIRDLREKNRQLQQAYEELKAAQAQIIEKERLEKELAVARQIQESILPHRLPQIAGLDVGARVRPTRAVGGDLFDLIDLGDGKLGIAVADVSDKGVPAAIFMALTRSLLRAEANRGAPPRQLLENVNHVMLEMNDMGMFVTVLYGVLDSATREFHFVRAGHELPIVLTPEGQLLDLHPGVGRPLGLFEPVALDEQRLMLSPGSLLVLYTDGITDQRNETGEFFGDERWRRAVSSARANTAQATCDYLFDAVDAFRGREGQFDDMTLVLVQVGTTS